MSLDNPVRNPPSFLAHARHVVLLFAGFAISGSFLCAQDRFDDRSIVVTERGVAASSDFLASQAGKQILTEDGPAMDAAIARNPVGGVTEPMMNGMGRWVPSILGRQKRQVVPAQCGQI